VLQALAGFAHFGLCFLQNINLVKPKQHLVFRFHTFTIGAKKKAGKPLITRKTTKNSLIFA
jgi:hypothetical protein